MKSRHRGLALLAAGALSAVMLALPGTAAADTAAAHHGSYGPHYLTDTAEYPGAYCRFNDDWSLVAVRLRPPVIYARDRGSRTDAQSVGWQAIVRQHIYHDATGTWSWQTISASSVIRATAHDNQPAPFGVRIIHLANPHGLADTRVTIKLIWYRPGTAGTVAGWAKHRVDNYRDPLNGTQPWCQGFHF